MSTVQFITSRDNPQVKAWRKLAQDSTAYRKTQQAWLEGDHLCRAALARGVRPAQAVFCESAWQGESALWNDCADRITVLPDALWATLSALESASDRAFVVDIPVSGMPQTGVATVVLDRVQDAGNVGAILRSASAFGFVQVIALRGTAALWSPKVLRAGMGAHFGLSLVDGADREVLASLQVPLLVTSSHRGQWLHQAALPRPCAWVMGHEGQGVDPWIEAKATMAVRIAQPGGEESLNVAAAAAICLYASAATVA